MYSKPRARVRTLLLFFLALTETTFAIPQVLSTSTTSLYNPETTPTTTCNCDVPDVTTGILIASTPHFSPTWPATLSLPSETGAAATATLTYVFSTWTAGSNYPSIKAAVYEAAPTQAQESLAVNGYDWNEVVKAYWYAAIPTDYQDMIVQEEEALQIAFDSATGNDKSDASRGQGSWWVTWGLVLGAGMGFVGII